MAVKFVIREEVTPVAMEAYNWGRGDLETK